jgi:hypothetical protein
MKFMSALATGALAMAGLAMIPASARAESILINSGPTVTALGTSGPYRWDYETIVTSTSSVASGDFFTIVDFNGLVPGTAFAATNWTATTPNTVGAPDLGHPGNFFIQGSNGSVASVPDNPFIPDLLFTYNGPVIPGQASLGHFGAQSTIQGGRNGQLMALDHADTSGTGDTVANTDQPIVPAPLPATANMGLVLLGAVGGLGAFRRLKNSKTVEA